MRPCIVAWDSDRRDYRGVRVVVWRIWTPEKLLGRVGYATREEAEASREWKRAVRKHLNRTG